ncbi:MAG: YraN family protein [Candidatus Nomurabacteria bacterium]
MAEHNDIGKKGEEIALNYLISNNFIFVEQNYNCKVGEIDIIVKKGDKICFVEVKTKRVKDFKEIENMAFRPEYNLSKDKKRKMLKAVKNYLNYRKIDESKNNIEIIGIMVFINIEIKKAKIKMYENLIL